MAGKKVVAQAARCCKLLPNGMNPCGELEIMRLPINGPASLFMIGKDLCPSTRQTTTTSMPANRPTPLARDPHHITCLECRAAKRKCHRPNTDTSCQRCTKFGLHCEYRPHHRGRRRDKVLATSTTVEPEPDTEPETNVTPTKPIARRDIAFSHVVPVEGDSYPYVSQQPTPPHPILRPESPAPSSEHVLLERLLTSPSPDPLDAGLLTLDQAQSLFRVYFDHLNYAVPLLDPVLCTPDSCRERSPLLFTAVITVTAKSARPRVYRSCLLLANRLVGKAVESNNSNLETVQALYLLAHFKEPHDTSAWKRVGYAIRMALELRLNVMASRPLRDDQSGREAIARERTWLNLLVSDYHLAIHHTLPRMITDDSIDDPQAWLDSHPVSLTQPADKALPALIEFSRMCRLYADLLAAMNGDPANLTLLAWLERRWNQWRKTWGPNQGLAPLQVAVLRLCDAFFGFHIYEYKLLFTARYREESSSRIPSQLELAFVQCVEAAIGPPRVFLAEFVSHGFLPYSPNILWVALAVTGVWLIRVSGSALYSYSNDLIQQLTRFNFVLCRM